MSADLRGIFEHNLSKAAILHLPQTIEQWDDVRMWKKPNKHCSTDPEGVHQRQMSIQAHWSNGVAPTEGDLETIWAFYEADEQVVCPVHPFSNRIECFFGVLRIFRHTIEVCHYPEHKYANLQEPEIAAMMLEINRLIANKFGASAIVYCPDSGFQTEWILEAARKAASIDQLIATSIEQFFEPPPDISKAMKYTFFVDTMEQSLTHLEAWNWNEVPEGI